MRAHFYVLSRNKAFFCSHKLFSIFTDAYICPLCLQGRSACNSDCTLALLHKGEILHYDFSPLARVTDFQSSPRFTIKGLQYFHHFSVMLCGMQVRL